MHFFAVGFFLMRMANSMILFMLVCSIFGVISSERAV